MQDFRREGLVKVHSIASLSCVSSDFSACPSILPLLPPSNATFVSSTTDEESTTFSTAFYHDDAEEASHREENVYDDSVLSKVIEQLMGNKSANETKNGEQGDDGKEEGLTDDVIAQHLKALANIKKKRPKYSMGDTIQNSPEGYDEDDDGEESYTTYELGDDDQGEDEDSDDECVDEEAYAGVDEIVKKLGFSAKMNSGAEGETKREWLEDMRLQTKKYDYKGAPETVSSKKLWLSQLAEDLLKEDSSREGGDDDGLDTVAEEQFKVNLNELNREAERAKKLIEDSTKRQTRAAQWKPTTKKSRREFKPKRAGLLDLDKIHQKLSAGRVMSNDPAAKKQASDVITVASPSIQPEVNRMFFLNVLASMDDAKDKPTEVIVTTTPTKPKRTKEVEPANLVKEDASAGRSVQSLEKLLDRAKTASVDVSQESSTNDVAGKPKKFVIPSGLPPYPGYGPKWPWHPNSPRAPVGYRECYMHHMGEYYFKYMEYLQARASESSANNTEAEEIMRSSLSEAAKFKVSKKAKKREPALSPFTFASKPGRARKNSVVPVVMPKIEEGSNSSSGSSVAVLERKIAEKKNQPDVLTIGKYHPKSKGRKGKIVVVSGKELDKQAREDKKRSKRIESLSSHSRNNANSISSPEAPEMSTGLPKNASSLGQPTVATPAADQGCACTIM